MKIAPVSADLLIKITLIAAAVAGAWYVAHKATSALSNATSAVWEPLSNAVVNTAGYVSPWNPENIFNSSVNKVVQTFSSTPGQTLGGVVYDVVNPNPLKLGNTIVAPMHDTYENPGGFAIY